ncbi:hypothetical protein JCM19992_23070 [Thermostilla marina]
MRRERRHELQHNDFAEWLVQWYRKLAPHGRLIGGIGVLIVLAVVLYIVQTNRSRSYREEAASALWAALRVGTTANLEDVYENYNKTASGQMALLIAADLHLQQGCNQLTVNKADAADEIRKALDAYMQIYERPRNKELKERALWGLARAYEALASTSEGQGEADKALEYYKQLIEEFPQSCYLDMAKRRTVMLQRKDTLKMLDALAAYEPPAPGAGDLDLPTSDGMGFDPGDLPTGGDVPNVVGEPSDESGAGDEPANSDSESPDLSGSDEAGPGPALTAPGGDTSSEEGSASADEQETSPATEEN